MNVWLVEGYLKAGMVTMFRTMTIIRPMRSKELILINSFRLNPETENELLKLGRISYVVRQSSRHPASLLDDLYYVEKFFAKCFTFKPSFVAGKSTNKKSHLAKLKDWEEFSEEEPPSCFGSEVQVQVLEVPLKEGFAESILYFEDEKCVIAAELMQNNDYDRKKVYGMTLSSLKLSKASQTMLTLAGYGGHLQTPKMYWTMATSRDELCLFHGKLMDLDWDRVICYYGGPSLQSAKRIRRDFIRDWPGTAFGRNVQLTLV
jgi:hypothetical protein